MRLLSLVTAVLLPLGVISEQHPIVEKKKLSKVISDSRFLSLHRELCEIDSVTNNENRIGIWIKNFLEAHHFKVITQEIPPRDGQPKGTKPRLNIYSWADPKYYKSHHISNKKKPSQPPSPKVLLSSHIDTVPPHFPYHLSYDDSSSTQFNRSNILISGRGTVDDKACVATQLTIAMELITSPPPSLSHISPTDLAMLFVVDEESGGEGMHHFSQSTLYNSTSSSYKAVIFGEPTENKLVAGHKGITMLYLNAQGRAAHSGYPWLGQSATSMIIPALMVLENLQTLPESEGGLPSSDKFGNTTVNIGLIQGGVAANVVPEHAHAEIAFRIAAGSAGEIQDLVTKAIGGVDPKALLDLKFGRGYGPVNFDVDVDGFESIVVNYGTDAPNLRVADGVKRYLYGPGSIFVAHGANEGLTVGELEAGLEGYRRLVEHALLLQ